MMFIDELLLIYVKFNIKSDNIKNINIKYLYFHTK